MPTQSAARRLAGRRGYSVQEFLPGTYSPYSGVGQKTPTPYDPTAMNQGNSPGAGWVQGSSPGSWVNPLAIANVNAGLTSGGSQKLPGASVNIQEAAPAPGMTLAQQGQSFAPKPAMSAPVVASPSGTGFGSVGKDIYGNPLPTKPAAAPKPVKKIFG